MRNEEISKILSFWRLGKMTGVEDHLHIVTLIN